MTTQPPFPLRASLEAFAEPKYRLFLQKLVPNTKTEILGVRMGNVRKVAAAIPREQWETLTRPSCQASYEERLVQAILLGKMDKQADVLPIDIQKRIEAFLPMVDNWAVCDTLCGSLKIAEKFPVLFKRLAGNCLKADAPFTRRFGAVMLLMYFIEEKQLPTLLKKLERTRVDDEYYVRMAVAWAVAECFLKFPDAVRPFLLAKRLDLVTHRQTLRKILESRRLPQTLRDEIQAMRK